MHLDAKKLMQEANFHKDKLDFHICVRHFIYSNRFPLNNNFCYSKFTFTLL